MEDFAKFCKTEKYNKTNELQNSKIAETGFIASRINRDNFWNLVFAAVFFIGIFAGFSVPQPFGSIIFWIAFITAIFLAKSHSHLSFNKEKLEFTTSQGKQIQKSGVLFIWLLITSCALAMGVIALFLDTNFNESLLAKLLFAFCFALFPSLYCILLNFPISVYFKKEAWIGNGKTFYSSRNSDTNFSGNAFDDSKRTSMNYDYLSDNMYHNSYLDRYYRK